MEGVWYEIHVLWDAFMHINVSSLWQEHTSPGHKENAIMLVRVRASGPQIVLGVQVEPVSGVHLWR